MEHSLFNGLIAKDAGVNLCTDPYDWCQHLGITLNYDEVLPFLRIQNTISCETFKPSCDEVLLTMRQHHPNVIYLNSEGQPHPKETLVIQSARLHEEYDDADADLRLLLMDLLVDTIIASSDGRTLMSPHQIYQIMELRIHVGHPQPRLAWQQSVMGSLLKQATRHLHNPDYSTTSQKGIA
jgi:hypothetical protein